MDTAFVEVSRPQYRLVLCFVAVVVIQALINCFAADSLALVNLTIADCLLVLLRVLPLVLFIKKCGWFHPITFGSLYMLCRSFPAKLVETYQLFVVGPSSLLVSNHDALVGWDSERLTSLAMKGSLLTCLSVLCYYLGFAFGPRFRMPQIVALPSRNMMKKIWLVCGISLGSFMLFLKLRGGLETHLLSWQEGRFEALQGYGVLIHGISLAGIACLLFLALDRETISSLSFWIIALASAAMKFFASGSRSQVVYWVFLGVLLWMFSERRVRILSGMGIIFVSVFLFGALGTFRNALTGKGEVDWSVLTNLHAVTATLAGDDEAQGELISRGGRQDGLLPILAYVPEQEGFLYGKSYGALLALPIPRALWPDKPRTIGALVGEKFFDYSTGFAIPPGAIGEAYWNFFIPGVVILFFLFGAFHGSLSDWFVHSEQKPLQMLIYLVVLFIGNSPATLAAINTLVVIIPLLLMILVFGFGAIGRREKFSN